MHGHVEPLSGTLMESFVGVPGGSRPLLDCGSVRDGILDADHVTNGKIAAKRRQDGLLETRVGAQPALQTREELSVVAPLESHAQPAQMSGERLCREHVWRVLDTVAVDCESVMLTVQRGLLEVAREQTVSQLRAARPSRGSSQPALCTYLLRVCHRKAISP